MPLARAQRQGCPARSSHTEPDLDVRLGRRRATVTVTVRVRVTGTP